ncbi:InlB B-repeat-containing protein, partial [Chitinivibrio alkaliphilus]|uniref:InlB B-repeat-containing protein n=1 Tax=Chitinivibrio alkaliphilus TaxID=1505232 RepID=UPI0005519F44
YTPHTEVTLWAESHEGYYFTGWSGDTVSADDTLEIVTDTGTHLSAGFDIVEYTLTYESNGADSLADNPETYTVESDTLYLAAPYRSNYDFVGWFRDSAFTNDPVTKILPGTTGDLMFYAQWSIHTYSLEVSA